MKTYHLLLKSHTDYPDYEDECKANSMEDAIDLFYNNLESAGYTREQVTNSVREIKE